MGRSLNLRIIAEGVETLEELSFLKLHQCEEAQGYYFSRPVPATQFAALLSRRKTAATSSRKPPKPQSHTTGQLHV
jgi:EAL domain-containing protein (putative c-di-GMP-specific phosphodiesterase class I)